MKYFDLRIKHGLHATASLLPSSSFWDAVLDTHGTISVLVTAAILNSAWYSYGTEERYTFLSR